MGTEEVPPPSVVSIDLVKKGPRTGCFICSGDHYWKNCPKRRERCPPRLIRVAKRGEATSVDSHLSMRGSIFGQE